MRSLLIISTLLYLFASNAQEIKTIHQLSMIENDLQSGDWFFIDIGNTLISKGKVAEKGVDGLVQRLQSKGVIVFGVTANSFNQRDQYTKMLWDAGFDFNKSARSAGLRSIYPVRFGDATGKKGFYMGCLYAFHPHGTRNDKGKMMEDLYIKVQKRTLVSPKRIVYVDDVLGNVKSVMARFAGIPKLLYFYVNVRAALEGQPVHVTDPNNPDALQVFLKVPEPVKRAKKPVPAQDVVWIDE